MKHSLGLGAALAAAAMLCSSCNSAEGPRAKFGENQYFQQVEFYRIFNAKDKLADIVITTRDYREAKDQQEWCSILDFEDGKYQKFEYQKNRKYQYGNDRRRHNAGFAWPVDFYDEPENRCILLLEVSSEYAVQGDNVSYTGSGYAEELANLAAVAFLVRRTKEGFAKEQAKDPEILKAADLVARAVAEKGEESTPEEDAQIQYLKFAGAVSLLKLSKAVDAAVELQKIVSRIESAAAAGGGGSKPARSDLMNLDYLVVACKRLIEEIKQGKHGEKPDTSGKSGKGGSAGSR